MQGNRLCVRWMTSLFRCDQLATCWCAASRFPIHGASRELTQASAAWTVQGGKKVSSDYPYCSQNQTVYNIPKATKK